MKKKFYASCLLSFCFYHSFTQSVGIGITIPDASAKLEISSNNTGLLIPRMTPPFINSIANPAKGLMVLDTATNRLMINMGTSTAPNWQNVVFKSGWALTGNSGIDPTAQFIGTTDNQPLRFRINNNAAGELNPTNGSIFLGLGAGINNNTGFSNVAIGKDALKVNSIKNNLVAIGDSALFNNGTGASTTSHSSFNTAIGSKSLYANTTGFANTAVGYLSMYGNTIGNNNTAIGNYSLQNIFSGSANVALGWGALNNTVTTSASTAVGASALYFNVTGANNTAVGFHSLFNNNSGGNNASVGFESMEGNISGSENAAIGFRSLYENSSGRSNVAIGTKALFSNTSNSNLVAVGDSSLYNNIATSNPTDGINNTAIGSKALYSNTIGAGNTAVGFNSLKANVSGYNNVAVGSDAMLLNTFGVYNVTSGFRSLYTNTIGSSNTAYGSWVLYSNNDGNNNAGLGYAALYLNSNGNSNVAAGPSAMYNNTSGSYNTAVGSNALLSNTGQNENTAIGSDADVVNNGIFNGTAIGSGTKVGQSNMMSFGNINVQDWAFGRSTTIAAAAFQVGVNSGNGNGAYLSNGGTWTNVSDINLKEEIVPVNQSEILGKISQLSISRWNYKGATLPETHIGPMAQQFKQLFGLGVENDDKSISTVDPAGIALAGIQELIKRNEQLVNTAIAQQQEIDLLKKTVEQLVEQNKLLMQLVKKN